MDPILSRLLEPISADAPCGPDLGYDPRFDAIETILKGKPEVEIGSVIKPAEPPDWDQLKQACLEFLNASRHLRPAVVLSCALLRTNGLAGFRDGLQVLRGLIEGQWERVYPLLDPEDNNDPQQRLNIISGITSPRKSYGLGWLQVVDYLHTVPLCRPKGTPPITLDLVIASAAPRPAAGAEGAAPAGPDAGEIARGFKSVSPDELNATRACVQEAREALGGIDAFLTSTLGSRGTIGFSDLDSVLQSMDRTLASHLPGAAAEPGVAGDAGAPVPGAAGGGVAISGTIASREDVVRVLDSICDYYRQCEPGSPMPYLLQRARKLATMNFVEVMEELSLANVEQLKPSMGSAVESPSSE